MFDIRYRFYRDLIRAKIIQLRSDDNNQTVIFVVKPDPTKPTLTNIAKNIMDTGRLPALTETYCLGKFLHEGPKHVEFSARECEALENFSLDLPCEEYAQPFPSLLIKLPRDYTNNRMVPFDGSFISRETTVGTHFPEWVIVRHEPQVDRILVLIKMSSTQMLTNTIKTTKGESLEQNVLATQYHMIEDSGPLTLNKEESQLLYNCSRLAISSCLMMMVYGISSKGHDNPSHAERLKRQIDKSRKRGKQPHEANLWQLETLPVRYQFSQVVQLYRNDREDKQEGIPTGRRLKIHWRRGHFRMQHFGIRNSLTKRIAIPAVLVNSELFLGDISHSQATYHTKGQTNEPHR